MFFKQGIIKEEKIKFLIGTLGVLIPYITLFFISIIQNDTKYLIAFLLTLFLPFYVLLIFVGVIYLEWFHIYDDRIEVRYIFGRKNIVYFDDVLFVEETTINLTRTCQKKFYIFDDGRKNNNSLFDLNSCYNKKKFNLRIYKTPELEDYVVNTLGLEVNKE